MFYLLVAIHVTLCAFLIGLVLIQQGKGADAGATFGGGGNNTVLGAGGAADFITKGTTSIAIAFMVTSILLARMYASGGVPTVRTTSSDPLAGSVMEGMEAPAETIVPSEIPMDSEAAGEESQPVAKEASAARDEEKDQQAATANAVEDSGADKQEATTQASEKKE